MRKNERRWPSREPIAHSPTPSGPHSALSSLLCLAMRPCLSFSSIGLRPGLRRGEALADGEPDLGTRRPPRLASLTSVRQGGHDREASSVGGGPVLGSAVAGRGLRVAEARRRRDRHGTRLACGRGAAGPSPRRGRRGPARGEGATELRWPLAGRRRSRWAG